RDARLRLHRGLERTALRPDAQFEGQRRHLPGGAAQLRLEILRRFRADDGRRRAGAHSRLHLLLPDPALSGPGTHGRRRERLKGTTMATIDIKAVRKNYGAVPILKGIDLS